MTKESFHRPRFPFGKFVGNYNNLQVGEVLSADLEKITQTSLISGLNRRGLITGSDFQTAVRGNEVLVKRLSTSEGVA